MLFGFGSAQDYADSSQVIVGFLLEGLGLLTPHITPRPMRNQ